MPYDSETMKYQIETFILACVYVCVRYVCARMTQPGECFFLTANTEWIFRREKHFSTYKSECVRVFVEETSSSSSSNVYSTGWSDGVLNFIFRLRCIHTFRWRCKEIAYFMCRIGLRIFRSLSSFVVVETCAHENSCIREFGIRFDIRVCVKRFHCLWPKWEIKKRTCYAS